MFSNRREQFSFTPSFAAQMPITLKVVKMLETGQIKQETLHKMGKAAVNEVNFSNAKAKIVQRTVKSGMLNIQHLFACSEV